MIGVIILHYNGGVGGGLTYVPLFSVKSYILYFLEAMFISSVNIFVLISGYFMSSTNQLDFKKPIRLLVQVVLFNEFLYWMEVLLTEESFYFPTFLRLLLPQGWFVILYTCLCILAPYINKLLNSLLETSLEKFVLINFILFSIWPYCVDVLQELTGSSFGGLSTVGLYGSQSGYTIVNFVLMYIFGAYLKRMNKQYNSCSCILMLFGCWLTLFAFSYFLDTHGFHSSLVFSYCTPVVILSAVLLFLIFGKIKMKNNAIINSLAKATFAVYLLNVTIISKIFYAEEYVQGHGLTMIIHVVLTCVSVIAISWLAQMAYEKITKPIYSWVEARLKINMVFYIE